MAEDRNQRVSVSRDTLRAELAEMELRLRAFLDDQLRHKADQAMVVELALKVDAQSRGDFTEAQKRALDERIESYIDGQADRDWTHRDRLMTVLSILTAVGMLVLSLAAALHGVSL